MGSAPGPEFQVYSTLMCTQTCHALQVPDWVTHLDVDLASTDPPFPISLLSDEAKPPMALHENQCRTFLPYTLTNLDGKPPSSPFSNLGSIEAPHWNGPLPDSEDELGRYDCVCMSAFTASFLILALSSDPNALGFFVKKDIIHEELIAEFKTVVREHVNEKSSFPLFVMLPHEDEELPDKEKLTAKIKTQILKTFKDSSLNVKFISTIKNTTIQIKDRSKNLSLELDLNERVTYDSNRRAVRAKDNPKLNPVCRKVYARVQSALTKTYSNGARFKRYKRYSNKIASIILSKKGSVRQPFHADTDRIEGISALAAMNGSFKLIVLKHSVHLLRRIAQIRAQWILSGSPIPLELKKSDTIAIEAWFDDACYAQLVREGWGTHKRLEAFTVTIPERAAIVFSTWLLHSGHEYSDGDIQVFNRLHIYFLPYDMGRRYDTVNLHRTRVDETGLSFSPALHFLPRPHTVPQHVQLAPLFGNLA